MKYASLQDEGRSGEEPAADTQQPERMSGCPFEPAWKTARRIAKNLKMQQALIRDFPRAG